MKKLTKKQLRKIIMEQKNIVETERSVKDLMEVREQYLPKTLDESILTEAAGAVKAGAEAVMAAPGGNSVINFFKKLFQSGDDAARAADDALSAAASSSSAADDVVEVGIKAIQAAAAKIDDAAKASDEVANAVKGAVEQDPKLADIISRHSSSADDVVDAVVKTGKTADEAAKVGEKSINAWKSLGIALGTAAALGLVGVTAPGGSGSSAPGGGGSRRPRSGAGRPGREDGCNLTAVQLRRKLRDMAIEVSGISNGSKALHSLKGDEENAWLRNSFLKLYMVRADRAKASERARQIQDQYGVQLGCAPEPEEAAPATAPEAPPEATPEAPPAATPEEAGPTRSEYEEKYLRDLKALVEENPDTYLGNLGVLKPFKAPGGGTAFDTAKWWLKKFRRNFDWQKKNNPIPSRARWRQAAIQKTNKDVLRMATIQADRYAKIRQRREGGAPQQIATRDLQEIIRQELATILSERGKVVDQTIINHRLLVINALNGFLQDPTEDTQSNLVKLLVGAVKAGATSRETAKKILTAAIDNPKEAIKLAQTIKG